LYKSTQKRKAPEKSQGPYEGQAKTELKNFHDFTGLEALLAVREIEFHLFASVQTPISVLLDNGVMDKDILAIVLRDEAISFGVVKPFDFSPFHTTSTSSSDGPRGIPVHVALLPH
jgi:hypothetical protein